MEHLSHSGGYLSRWAPQPPRVDIGGDFIWSDTMTRHYSKVHTFQWVDRYSYKESYCIDQMVLQIGTIPS
jgi:hypothetical protein